MTTASGTRLCPHCANSIAEDAAKCPYCKANVDATAAPQWPTREQGSLDEGVATETSRVPTASKLILVAGLVVFAVGVFLIGGQKGRIESQPLLEEKLKELQEKERKIQDLEKQLTQVRQELNDSSNQFAELKGKLGDSQKELVTIQRELSTTQQRLSIATREADRLTASRAQTASKTAPRPNEPPPSAPARRAADPGFYETTRATSVYAEPSGSARVVSRVGKGTKVTVVRSIGDWLEVRSQHGNPPGFIRWDDAMFVGKDN